MTKPHKKTEDMLPKVLVIGKPSDCVPRIIICDGMKKNNEGTNERRSSERRSAERRSSERKSNLQPKQPPKLKDSLPCPGVCTQQPIIPPCPPEPPRRTSRNRVKYESHECCPPPPPPPPPRQPSNFDETTACSKLMIRMHSLKEEMEAMVKQNERMQQQIKGNRAVQQCRVKQSDPCARPATYPKNVEGRFRDYSKHTNLLEKQVETMEESVRRLNEQFIESEKRQREMEMARLHAEKIGETLACQAKERSPQLQCRPYCKGGCAQQTERCSCSAPNYKCG